MLPNIIKKYAFCREDQVEYIQCRQVSNKASYDVADDVNTICSTKGGFACYGSLQPDGQCNDYEIRVYCKCDLSCKYNNSKVNNNMLEKYQLKTQHATCVH